MARRTRHSTSSQGDDNYSSIVNKGYLSEYFLAYRLRDGLSDLYRAWDEREKAGDRTARTGLRGLSSTFSRLRIDAAATGIDRASPDDLLNATDDSTPIELASLNADAVTAQHELNAATLDALVGVHPVVVEMLVGDRHIPCPSSDNESPHLDR